MSEFESTKFNENENRCERVEGESEKIVIKPANGQ